MQILVGSLRPAKIDGVREALAAVSALDPAFADAQLRSVDLTEIAPRMPMSQAQIVAGARRRAAALSAAPEFRRGQTLAIGLEGGLHPIDVGGAEVFTLETWAAVTDGAQWGYGAGGSLEVPVAIAARVRRGEELGDIMDELTGESVRGTRGAWGVLTRDLVGRRDAFRLAVIAALAPFYNRPAYAR